MNTKQNISNIVPVDVGSYTASEAARLLKIPQINIRRWLHGYHRTRNNVKQFMPPLWNSELAMFENHFELSFRDLIELRFVSEFVSAGVGLLAIRNCLEYARECVDNDHPFSTQKFATDGKTIFLESIQENEQSKLLNLKIKQYEFKQVIEKTFKHLDIDQGVVYQWRPFKGKKSIVIDPTRSFGQPITSDYGVPTIVLKEAVEAEGSISRVANLYEVSERAVKDALEFEKGLAA